MTLMVESSDLETLYDGTDLDGGPALWSGGSSGGWSMAPAWFYTGGNPYIWTFFGNTAQTPGGAGEALTGAMSNQNSQRAWWGLCEKAQVHILMHLLIFLLLLFQME